MRACAPLSNSLHEFGIRPRKPQLSPPFRIINGRIPPHPTSPSRPKHLNLQRSAFPSRSFNLGRFFRNPKRPLDKRVGSSSSDEFLDLKTSGGIGLSQEAELSDASSFDLAELKRELEEEERSLRASEKGEGEEEEELIPLEGGGSGNLGSEIVEKSRIEGGRQMVKRSTLLAKQVISIRSARSLGFVSQLWVDTRLWVVALVEVRPNLLSGEIEKFLLEDICQVGDVVLVQDESVIENEFKMIGLDSLVGYSVVTSGRRNVGKVRGYTFNINSGYVESLELDSFGFSIIPSSLVSTYCLFVEDVLEVVSDTVVVHESAVSRVQRLTKGIWNTQNMHGPENQMHEDSEFGKRGSWPVERQSSGERSGGRKFRRKMRDIEDDWELPMDY
ncbi:uncharacterized protein [Typha latifolia]|uniref:uncharacterized protein isoform X2 n=1 Tax=Typha latifolia TaxID=4733 RepID=UPI003C2AD602